jgi:hypothetical protein
VFGERIFGRLVRLAKRWKTIQSHRHPVREAEQKNIPIYAPHAYSHGFPFGERGISDSSKGLANREDGSR